jgi:hypothetical protein
MQAVRNDARDPHDVQNVGDDAVKVGGRLIVRVGSRVFTAWSEDDTLSLADLANLIARKLTG